MRKYETLTTRQVGQRIRLGTLPAHARGIWRCPNHPKRKLGTTDMLQWPRGSRVCGGTNGSCQPPLIVFPTLGIIIDLSAK